MIPYSFRVFQPGRKKAGCGAENGAHLGRNGRIFPAYAARRVAFCAGLWYFIHDCRIFYGVSIIKRFFLLLFLLLALTTGAAAAGTITDLRTDCLVAGNGSCQVTQTVTIEFTGIEQSLTIPLGANAKRASIAGYHAQKTVEDGYTLFQLKDDAGFAGSRTFTVTYTLSGLVTETDGEQTLNLPLLCPKWDYPIEHFSFTVTMPKDIETVPSFSSGYYGDVIEDYMTAARQGAVLLGDLDTALKDHESLTMTLALGPRYFTGTYSGWSANWVAAAFCILFAVLALGYWFVTLRSPRLSVSSRSLPPDSALPCDLPFLLAGAKPDFNMLLCHWASLGYLSIAVDPQGHVSLLRHMYMGNERRGLECKLFAALFARADRCDGASIHYKNTAKSAAGALARFWGRRLYERGSGNVLVMRALAALCSGVALLSAASFLLPVLPLRWLVLALCFVLGAAMSACVQLAAIRWYLRHVPVLALGGVCAVAMLVLGNLSGTFPLMLLAAALSALTGVLTRHGGQRSRAGGRLLGQVLGFRQFLRRVTPSHLLMRLQRDPQYFYRTLPYAEAMGLGAMFARKFGDTELDPCEWYNEPNLPRTAEGFYEKLKETLALLNLSIQC
ncbi:MAG: hypothetical protein DBX57_06945 [Clostridia bacterium]|nr:MAG: hypothetical protein DBX57_06945 [Clostridia bacterium]